MRHVRGARIGAIGLISVIAITLALAAPVAAGIRDEATTYRPAMASHVDPADCDDIAIDAGGNILINGVALTAGQLALLDASVIAALELAAAASASTSADASQCTDVAIVLVPPAVTVNADISVCSVDVMVNGDGSVDLGDVTVESDLLDAELTALLEIAAAAEVEACVIVTVTDNEVAVDAAVQLCATATLNADGSLTVNGVDLDVDTLLDVDGELEVGVEVEVALAILSTLDLTDDSVRVVVAVIDLAGCGAGAGGTPPGTASASPSDGVGASASPSGGGSGAGPSQLPDTSSPDAGQGAVAITLFALSLLVWFGSLAVLAVRRWQARDPATDDDLG